MTKPDPTTGFPEVPEGYFWEVTDAATNGWLRLHLKKKVWIFSCEVQWTVVEPPFTPQNFYEEALYVLREWERSKERIALEEASKKYIGKYPPKNMKDVSK